MDMNNKRGIAVIIAIVLIFAGGFQLIRSNFIMNLLKNESSTEEGNYDSVSIPDHVSMEKFLIIYSSNEPGSIKIKNNIEKTIRYMKKDVIVKEKGETTDFTSYKGVIIALEDLTKIQNLDSLMSYVEKGGNLFLAERPTGSTALSSASEFFGITSYGEIYESKGIKLLSNVLIKGNGLGISGDIVSNSSLAVKLNRKASVLASSFRGDPILWETPYGKGNVMVFNGTSLGEKINRGLIAGSLSLLYDKFIYPVIGTKLMYIDDFPAPIPQGSNESISAHYGMSTYQFYREVWWPDIIKGAKTYNLKYTGTIIENYSNNTTSPFETEISDKDLILFGSELIKNGGELGIHGYNHQSLALPGFIKQDLGYTPWDNKENMSAALGEVERYSKTAFPSYDFKVYVPPSNILSPEGRETLKSTLPNIKVIASIYTNHALGDAYEQEFQVNSDFTELPRLTSGYKNDEETLWFAYNGITSLGIFAHFIHPDDVLDSRRNGNESWVNLLKDYNSLMEDINNNFSWLKPETASKGAEILKGYSNVEPYVEYKGDVINVYCKNYKENSYFIIRSTEKVTSNKDCVVEEIDGGVYLITGNKPFFSLKVGR